MNSVENFIPLLVLRPRWLPQTAFLPFHVRIKIFMDDSFCLFLFYRERRRQLFISQSIPIELIEEWSSFEFGKIFNKTVI